MEIEIGGSRFESLRSNARWAKWNLDTRFPIEDMDNVAAHLQDCIDNPTRGFLANREAFDKINYPFHYNRNIDIAYKDMDIKALDKILDMKVGKLYPNSLNARNYLIKNQSIVLNYVKPIDKNFKRTAFKFVNKLLSFCKL